MASPGRTKREPEHLVAFRALSREDQRIHLLSVTKLCWDGAPVSLARKIEIYLEDR